MSHKDDKECLEHDAASPFRFVGIALVVDRKGESPRCVMRYPPGTNDDDMFFRLSPRQIAKLFRPKKPLCRKPMTLSVEGTVFCCLAVDCEDTQGAHDDHLVLFSIVVAVVPKRRISSIPISGWFHGRPHYASHQQEQKYQLQSLLVSEGNLAGPDARFTRASVSFLAIRRVHISLSRVCKVLEREERRCQYVSLQSQMFTQIRNDMQQKWREMEKRTGSQSLNSSPTSLTSSKPRGHRHRRTGSFSAGLEVPPEDDGRSTFSSQKKQDESLDAEKEQELLEIFMAAAPASPQHEGNLARELVKLFHSLARNDHDFPPTPTTLLTGRDGFVYINRHISVPVEAVSPHRRLLNVDRSVARPYQTLLFPYASPNQLLEALSKAGSSTTRRLQQFLMAMNPRNSLTDVATDAHLPLQVVLELATYLLRQGVCVTSPLISRTSKFLCPRIGLIQEHSLSFAQVFSNMNIFVFVSFLTQSNRTLAESAVLVAAPGQDSKARMVQESLSRVAVSAHEPQIGDRKISSTRLEDMEDLLLRVVVWLCARRVLVHLEEFLVAEEASFATGTTSKEEEKHPEKRNNREKLFEELMAAGCLSGTASLNACSWRVGVGVNRLRSYAEHHRRIRIMQRAALRSDDWGDDILSPS